MPPLRRTTARAEEESVMLHSTITKSTINISALNPLHRRVPNKLVQLQSQPRRNIVGDHPLSQFLRIEQAMRTIPRAGRIFTKRRRKQNRIHPFRKLVPPREFARKVIVGAAAQNKLDLVVRAQR